MLSLGVLPWRPMVYYRGFAWNLKYKQWLTILIFSISTGKSSLRLKSRGLSKITSGCFFKSSDQQFGTQKKKARTYCVRALVFELLYMTACI